MATQRISTTNCSNDWWSESCTPIHQGHGKYSWGDATIWLGWYIAVLATEHAAFTKIGKQLGVIKG